MKHYIMEQLKQGKTSDEIALSLTEALNSATEEYENRQKNAEFLTAAAEAINNYISVTYPDKAFEKVTDKDIKSYIGIRMSCEELAGKLFVDKETNRPNPFEGFFKSHGIL